MRTTVAALVLAAACLSGAQLQAQDQPAAVNPLADNPDAVQIGMGLFRSRCADCHGMDARGVRGPDLTQVWASGRTDAGLFRTVRRGIPGTEMRGYQADIGQNYWGCLYDESRRNRVLAQASPRAVAAIHHDRWNEYVIRALGDDIKLFLNGVQSVSYEEPDPEIPQQGRIAVQVHAGKPMKVEFKDIAIKELP